jgi:hypothetical protein
MISVEGIYESSGPVWLRVRALFRYGSDHEGFRRVHERSRNSIDHFRKVLVLWSSRACDQIKASTELIRKFIAIKIMVLSFACSVQEIKVILTTMNVLEELINLQIYRFLVSKFVHFISISQ